jgi:hypothetical protein
MPAMKKHDPRLLCLVCDQPVAREHMIKVRIKGKWMGTYHRICFEIVAADLTAQLEAADSIVSFFRRRRALRHRRSALDCLENGRAGLPRLANNATA